MFLYLNASIGGALLQPLLELQVSRTGQPYAAQDLGDKYPAATDPTVAPTQGVERECPYTSVLGPRGRPCNDWRCVRTLPESGNMLIMELAHARISGNGTLLSQYVRGGTRNAIDPVRAQPPFLQYNTTKRWADYLVDNAVASVNQYVLLGLEMDGR